MPDISEIVDVTISVQSSAITRVGFDSILINGNGGTGTNDGDFNAGFTEFEVRKYTTLAALTGDSDIKPASGVINLATAIFSQVPAVSSVYVSRTDEGTPVAQVSQLLYNTVPLVSGQSVEVSIDGTEIAGSPIAWNTDNDTTMDDVATAIAAESGVTTAVASVDGSGSDKNLITITGATPGDSFQVTSDIKTGATVDESITATITTAAADTLPSDAINSIIANNNEWFGYVHSFVGNTNSEVAASSLAANKKYGGFTFSSASAIPSLGTNYSFSIINQSADSVKQYANASWLSNMLGRDVGSYNPAYLTLEVTDTSSLSATDEALLRAGDANQYSTIGGVDVTYDGKAGNGGWIDTYINVLWLQARIQEDIFALMAAKDKIPFTDAGIALVTNELSRRLQIAEDQGVLAAEPKFVINAPLAADVPAADKSNRLLTGITFTAYTQGAVNLVQINGTLVD